MGIEVILILAAGSALARLLLRGKSREWLIYLASLLAVFCLQPELPVRGLDFWLPLASLVGCLLAWVAVSEAETRWSRDNLISIAAAAGLSLALGMTRYLDAGKLLTPSQPPPVEWIVLALGMAAGLAWLLGRRLQTQAGLAAGLVVGLIVLLVLVKTPLAAQAISSGLRELNGQGTARASALDVRWLGLSYLVFRILHTLRDWQAGRKINASLREYLIYLLFFPAFTAGPIERAERFLKSLRGDGTDTGVDWEEGGKRLAIGLFKKFVLSDSLALLALNAVNAGQARSGGWAWVMLYAYALQIYLDFSGYTDIAIGLGRILGVRLPENFNAPYLKTNLTLFWNNWHMTLTQWFRAYYFNPVTRSLRRKLPALPADAALLVMQVSTMVLIGLWHGITVNFLMWGLWHGVGLFIQNRYSEWATPRLAALDGKAITSRTVSFASGLLTFHYVALGWVWFVTPDPATAGRVFSLLLGVQP